MFENKSNVIIASILLFLAALFWSGNFIVGKIAGLNDIPPISLNILRWSLAFIILLPFTYKEMLEKKELIFKNNHFFVTGSIKLFLFLIYKLIWAKKLSQK